MPDQPDAPVAFGEKPAGDPHIGYVRLTTDARAVRGPLYLWGATLSDVSTVEAVFYDGDNESGRRIFSLRTTAVTIGNASLILPRPILLERGLYVDVDVDPDDLTVFVSPLRG